jgi:hypothetical protein
MYCRNCGKQIEDDSRFCEYCGASLANDSQGTQGFQSASPILPNATTNRIFAPDVKFAANFWVNSFISQGGHLWITSTDIIFKPHALNFNSRSLEKKHTMRISDVAGYEKSGLNTLSIISKSGMRMGIVSWNKDRIIQEIEKRKVAENP